MASDSSSAHVSKPAFWTGWVISALLALLMIATGIMSIVNPAQMEEGMKKFGYPAQYARGIVITEVICALLYLFPRTAVLGAILLTGYLGGATATHVRVKDPLLFMPIVAGMLIWLGLFLRDRRVRALIPFRE
jgi:hypothetical protein